jgi:HEPN domain-containing protein
MPSPARIAALLDASTEAIAAAEVLAAGGRHRHARDHVQQAAEAAVWALLEHCGVNPGRERRLGRLARVLPETSKLWQCIRGLAPLSTAVMKQRAAADSGRIPPSPAADLVAREAALVSQLRADIAEIVRLPAAGAGAKSRVRRGNMRRKRLDSGDERLQTAVALLVDGLNPAAVYLFGSRARGDHLPDSDFDLLVVTEQPIGYDDAYRPLLGRALPCDVVPVTVDELVEAEWSAGGILRAALDEGRLLYGRPKA